MTKCGLQLWIASALVVATAGCGRLFYTPRDGAGAGLDGGMLALPDVWLPDAPGLDAPLPDVSVELPDAAALDAPGIDAPSSDAPAPDASAVLPRCETVTAFTGAMRLPFSMPGADGISVRWSGAADSPIVFSVGGALRLALGPAATSSTALDTAGPGENPEQSLDGSFLYYDRADGTGIGYATESGGRYFIGPGLVGCNDSVGISVDCINLDISPTGVVLDDYGNLHTARMLSTTEVGDAVRVIAGIEDPTTFDGMEVLAVMGGAIVQYMLDTGMTTPVTGLGTGALSDPEITADGQRLYYVLDGELWVASRSCRP